MIMMKQWLWLVLLSTFLAKINTSLEIVHNAPFVTSTALIELKSKDLVNLYLMHNAVL